MKKILVTGAAGFIGFHLAQKLCAAGHEVFGVDNLNDYYDVGLKKARLAELKSFKNFTFEKSDIADAKAMDKIFEKFKPEIVMHLAAQAGVRYSIENPRAYTESNITGFMNILEGCRHNKIQHLIYASSSSVYGANTKVPFAVSDNVDHPVSLYAATKKANELMAHSYAHLYGLPVTGLRFFTVYGPWGRPDMAYYKFTKAIFEGKPIDVYNNGDMKRDFTYIDDITAAMVKLMEHPAKGNPQWSGDHPDPASSTAPYRLYNIGNNAPEGLMSLIGAIEEATGRKAETRMLPMQPGDIYATFADVDALMAATGFKPATPLAEGIGKFVEWYKTYHKV